MMTLKPAITSIEAVRAPVALELAEVEARLILTQSSDTPLGQQVSRHVMGAGGKRLRPMVLLLAANHLGHTGERPIQLATAIEWVHTATLLHDDVVDDSPLRRGRPTANQVFGNSASVLVGDYLYARAFMLLAQCESIPIIQTMAAATQQLAQGELLQLAERNNLLSQEETHLAILQAKTGTLFEAAARLGGLVAQAKPEVCDSLALYGRYLGIAFQLIDDLLDYEGNAETLGKRLGDDFVEGNLTLPLIYALRTASTQECRFLKEALKDKSLDALGQIQAVLKAQGAFDYTRARALDFQAQALCAIAPFSDTIYRQSMVALAHYAIERDF